MNGKVFVPAVASDTVDADDGNRMDVGIYGQLVQAWNTLFTVTAVGSVVGLGFIPVVWLRSRQVGGPLAMPVTARITEFYGTSNYLFSQNPRSPRFSKHKPPNG